MATIFSLKATTVLTCVISTKNPLTLEYLCPLLLQPGVVVEHAPAHAVHLVVPEVEREVGDVGEHVHEGVGQPRQLRITDGQQQLVALDPLEGVQAHRADGAGDLQLFQLRAESAKDLKENRMVELIECSLDHETIYKRGS